MQLAPLILLELHFKVTSPITNLPHYHGAQWSALFRNVLKRYLTENSLSASGIWIHPVETGILAYEKDDPLHLGLTFPVEHTPIIKRLTEEFNSLETSGGHFQPGKSVILKQVYCRIRGDIWNPEENQTLNDKIIRNEITKLESLPEATIQFYSPLRLPRPKGHKKEGHHYCDNEFFLSGPADHRAMALLHLIRKIRTPEGIDFPLLPVEDASLMKIMGRDRSEDIPKIVGGSLNWIDISYGADITKTIGGVVGKLKIQGTLSQEMAEALVIGQYTGIGKNPAFGLGFYIIPELDRVRRIQNLSRGTPLLQRALSVQSLKISLGRLPNSSPGPDMLSVNDLKKAGDLFLNAISDSILKGSYKQGGVKRYLMPKADGTHREVYVQNVADRLAHKAVADYLLPVVDRLLSNSSYAYRRGLNRKGAASALRASLSEGFTSGLKADISAFFDSVDINILRDVLEGFLPFEPLVGVIISWLRELQKEGIKGLPQGSPLSPMLSNLYLDRFDRDMDREGFRLIRYGDDFVVLFRDDMTAGEGLMRVEKSLANLGLLIKHSKTAEIKKDEPINFLGYVVTSSEISEAKRVVQTVEQEWSPVFKDEWTEGLPVYLTSICRGAYSSGPALVIKTDEEEEKIPWNTIGRLVVVGRSPFSGGVVYRAVKEEIPVSFIDIMGRSRGHLYPEYDEMPEIVSFQAQLSKNEEFCLSFAKEIISAKVNNSMVLLRRNSIHSAELKEAEHKINSVGDMEKLRGYEGIAAKTYFGAFAEIVKPFEFKGRVYHPPDGPVNVLLSLGYTLIYNRLASVLKDKGFNARKGFFHREKGRFSALAGDLMEELRHISERIVLSLIHRGEIKENDFTTVKKNDVIVWRLKGEGFRKYIHLFEITMARKISYQGLEKLSYNAYLDEMADNLKRSLKLNIPYKALRIH